MIPGVPAGPLVGPSVRAGVQHAFAYGPASAHLTTASGIDREESGNAGMRRGFIPLFPVRVAVRGSFSSWLDAGSDLGWLDGGLQLRAGPLNIQNRVPWGVELEWRTGAPAVFSSNEEVAARSSYRVRMEAYPALYGDRTSPRARTGFGVATLGISTGQQLTPIHWPVDDSTPADAFFSEVDLLRRETRLEATLGFHARNAPLAVTLALMPWWVVEHGSVDPTSCSACTITPSLDSHWGFSLVASTNLILFEDWEARSKPATEHE